MKRFAHTRRQRRWLGLIDGACLIVELRKVWQRRIWLNFEHLHGKFDWDLVGAIIAELKFSFVLYDYLLADFYSQLKFLVVLFMKFILFRLIYSLYQNVDVGAIVVC